MKLWQTILMNEAVEGGDGGGSSATPSTDQVKTNDVAPSVAPEGNQPPETANPATGFNSGAYEEVEPQPQEQPQEQPKTEYSHDEAYKDFDFKLKDGYSLTDEQKSDYLAMAKEKGVKPEQMQSFVDKHIEANERNISEYKKTVAEWDNEVRNDPVLGGDNFPQTKKNLNTALSGKIEGGAEVRKLLAETGLISEPSVVKFLNNLGKMMVDDKMQTGKINTESKTDYKSIYPNTQYDY